MKKKERGKKGDEGTMRNRRAELTAEVRVRLSAEWPVALVVPPDEAGRALAAQGGGLAAGKEGGGGEQRGPEEQQLLHHPRAVPGTNATSEQQGELVSAHAPFCTLPKCISSLSLLVTPHRQDEREREILQQPHQGGKMTPAAQSLPTTPLGS